ncbi:MAG TPA: MFS transporter [Candidatus Limnocylindria bacterium]|nr:MFS transporter [Candidatus Limnocylindria bacterium]
MTGKLTAHFNGLFYGWRMVAAGCAMRMLGGGFHLYGFTIFFLPITNELGLSRAATSLVFSLARAEGAIEGPLAGYFIDRYGPRPMMLAGIILSGLGYMLLATVHSYAAFLAVYLGVISLAFSAGFMHSPMVLANSWFIRRRAMAMTLISSAIGIGGTLITPILAFTVAQWGWRYGAFITGIGLIVTGVPVALYVKRSPESMGLVPDGVSIEVSEQDNRKTPSATEREFSLKQAMKTAAFWKLILATTTRVGVFNSITVHFVPIMVWRGASEAKAAALLATLALMSLPSHLFVGWIADRVNKPRLMAACMVIGAGAVAILAYGVGEWALWTFTLLFTFVEALFPVSWATVGDYFGRKHFATIRGSMSFFYLWGPALGPVITGYVYDRHQSYAPLMSAYIAIALVAGLLYASLRQPKLPA